MSDTPVTAAEAAPPSTVFEAVHLSVAVPPRPPLLAGLSLRMLKGEVLSVLGRHGAGGETLRDLLLGTIDPRAEMMGTFRFNPNARQSYLSGAAAHALSPYLSVERQLSRILARRQKIPLGSATEELRLALERLPGAPGLERLHLLPEEIEPREQSLAFLALALAKTPDIIIADDPASGLDPVDSDELIRFLLAERARDGFGLLYFTGDPSVAARLGGRIAVLRQGHLVEDGSAGRLSSTHAHPYTQALFRAVPRLQAPEERPRTGPRSEPLLQVRSFAFEKPKERFDPASGITFELRRGASMALIGEHGSGRRALTRAVVGLRRVPHGRIIFDSVDIGVLSSAMRARLRRRVAFISGDDAVLDPRMSVLDTVLEPMRMHVSPGRGENRKAAATVLKRVGMGDVPPARRTGDLGVLDRRRLQVARVLAAVPQLLVLYEPLSRLDVLGQALLLELLKEFRERAGAAFLLVTADFAVAQALCETALVMRDRRVVESGAIAEIIKYPHEPYTKALLGAVSLTRQHGPAALPPGPDEG